MGPAPALTRCPLPCTAPYQPAADGTGRDGTGQDRTGLSALTALPAAMAAAQRRTAPTPSVAPNPLRVDAAQGSAPHSRLMGALSPLPPADGADLSIVPCTAPHSVGPGADAASAGGRGTALPPPPRAPRTDCHIVPQSAAAHEEPTCPLRVTPSDPTDPTGHDGVGTTAPPAVTAG